MKLLKIVDLLKNAKNLKIFELLLKILMIFIAIFQIIINKNLNKKKKEIIEKIRSDEREKAFNEKKTKRGEKKKIED